MEDWEKVDIIEDNEESIKEFSRYGWGQDEFGLTKDHIKALLKGKCLAFCDGEYTHILRLKKGVCK